MSKEQKEQTIDKVTKEMSLPIDRMHYTALTQLLRNPLIFKLKYVLGVYDGKIGMGGMVGRAGHEALKVYYGANPEIETPKDKDKARDLALDFGLKYIDEFSDSYISYGKTGSREQMLKMYAQAMKFYFAEEPEYHKILMAEEKLESDIKTIDGQMLPLPAVAVPDVVHQRKDGGIEIVDVKFVKSFTDWETEDYIKIVQSQFIWHVLRGAKDISADRMLFREVKYTENQKENAGKPQIRDYEIPFSHEQYRIIFYNLYRDVVNFISNPNAVYLPNLSDPFDGEQAGLLYAQGLISADMSDVEVMHKVKDVAFTSKKFVPSRLERIENKHLEPQEKIKLRLAEFGIPVEPQEIKVGASVTQYQFKVSAGISMNVFKKHKADIARALEAKGEITILAPIPGTSLVGIEVANENKSTVTLQKQHFVKDTLSLPIGITVQGDVVKILLNEAPHLLIAGATGSGKSVLLHSLITALEKQMSPKDMQLVLIDPKRVELVAFSKSKHLRGGKIVYEYEDAVMMLKGLTTEMEDRYKELERTRKRDISSYNQRVQETGINKKMHYIVVVIDEFADLMLQSKASERRKKKQRALEDIVSTAKNKQLAKDFAKAGIPFKPELDDKEDLVADELIVRLAAMARAVGIHLIIATQRPSVDVVTGLIKANFPTRISLRTSSATDSKVILGEEGAEKLNGKGDMILMHPSVQGKARLQGFLTE